MSWEVLAPLIACVVIVAFLYSAVGHAGASGYIAVMSIFSVAPGVIKPTALILNIAVATIASFQFWRAGHFRWRLFWPFAVLAMPSAWFGGKLELPAHVLKLILGMVLLFSAARFLLKPPAEGSTRPPAIWMALMSGGALGFLAGLTGTGGGIFLTPLMMFMRWAPTRTVAAVSALFILANSAAGLAGYFSSAKPVPSLAFPLVGAAIAGGVVGSYLGSRRFPVLTIKRLLAAVLTVAAVKLIFA